MAKAAKQKEKPPLDGAVKSKKSFPERSKSDLMRPAPDETGIDKPTHFIGIGASAGGLEAIEAFFDQTPVDTGMAFIVVQHLSPDYKSLMVELLSKRTVMPVVRIEDGVDVEKNRVYLIPPKKNLTLFHGRLMLSEQDHTRGINLPIDIFFKSLAEDQGEKAVGIILSGTGSDGMRGVRAIKESGGTVMVQDEESAKFDGMPRSAISTGLADFILPPGEMPGKLVSFFNRAWGTKGEPKDSLMNSDDNITKVFALLREKTKIDFTFYKPSTVFRRIERRISVNQLFNLGDYVDYMRANPSEVVFLYRELLIGVTSFFRDREAFEMLAEKWMPEILSRAGADGQSREIRLWVAGCSTGEEAYTMAIIVREAMAETTRAVNVKIFATDVDKDAILYAGNGLYPESIAADLSPYILSRYFTKVGDSYQVSRSLREMVVFARHNLVKDPPFTNIDLLSCRNLLIYLQPVLQKKVLDFFNFSLVPGGVLMLGASESTGELSDHFDTLSGKWKFFRAKGLHRTGVVPTTISVHPEMGLGLKGFKIHQMVRPQLRSLEEERVADRLLVAAGEEIVHSVVVINEAMEIVYSIGNSFEFFKVPVGHMVRDVMKMAVKEISIPLATGVQKVFKTGRSERYTNIRLNSDENRRSITMIFAPMPARKGQQALVGVFFEVTVDDEGPGQAQSRSYDADREARQRIADLEHELQFTKESLQATIEELETSNEELQATNEELIASNEELQATNEELQSVNEELYTVNAEYQSKIIELTELYNDMDNIVSISEIGLVLLDENLCIRRFTPPVAAIYKIIDKDIGRPLAHLNHGILGFDPIDSIRGVIETGEFIETEVVTVARRYLMRIHPYRIAADIFSGIVMAFIDITSLRSAEYLVERKRTTINYISEVGKIGSWDYDLATGIHTWSDQLFDIHEIPRGRQPEPAQGINYYHPDDRPVISEAFSKACREGVGYDLVLRIVTANGNLKWVRAIGRPELVGGRVARVAGVFQDITEFISAKKARSLAEKRYSWIVETLPDGMALVAMSQPGIAGGDSRSCGIVPDLSCMRKMRFAITRTNAEFRRLAGDWEDYGWIFEPLMGGLATCSEGRFEWKAQAPGALGAVNCRLCACGLEGDRDEGCGGDGLLFVMAGGPEN